MSAHLKPKARSGHVDFPQKVGTVRDWLIVSLFHIMLIMKNYRPAGSVSLVNIAFVDDAKLDVNVFKMP